MLFQQLKLLEYVNVLRQSMHAAFPFVMLHQIKFLLKKPNLSPPFWSLLCCSHSYSAVTSGKLQAINSTRCSPLLQLCLGNTQPCQALLGIFTLLRARPCGFHTNLLLCPSPVMPERIFLNQNQMSSISFSGEHQCKWIAKPKSPSLMFPRMRIFIYLLLRSQLTCKHGTLLSKLINLQLIPRNCQREQTELFLQS